MPSVIDQNPGLLELANTLEGGLRSVFMTSLLGGTDDSWREVAMEVPARGRKDIYNFISDMPGMKKWLSNRINETMTTQAFEMGYEKFEGTIEVDEDDLEDDNLGTYSTIAAQQGLQAARMPAELVFGLLEGGFTGISYDNTTFFSTSHAFGSNRTTSALTAAALETGLNAMAAMTTASGQRVQLGGRIKLVVPTALAITSRTIVDNDVLADGTRNFMRGLVEIVIAPALTDANNWYLIRQDGVIRPILFATRRPVRFRRDDAALFDKGKIYFGSDARWGRSYGLPQYAYGAIVA